MPNCYVDPARNRRYWSREPILRLANIANKENLWICRAVDGGMNDSPICLEFVIDHTLFFDRHSSENGAKERRLC
jgi:hypothetical protein